MADLDLLLLIGEDDACPEVFYLQLYDVEEDDWFPHVTLNREEFDGASGCFQLGVVGSTLYFSGDTSMESEDNKVPYFGMDFRSKGVTRLGRIEKLTEFTGEVTNFISDSLIYFVDREVWYYDLKKKLETSCGFLETEARCASIYCNGILYCISRESCHSFNVATKEIKTLKKHKFNCNAAVTAMNGKVYAVQDHGLNYLAIYTPEADKWITLQTRGPKEIKKGKLIVCNGRLLCVDTRCYVFEYLFDEKKWELKSRDRSGAITSNKTVFTVKKALTRNWK